MSTGTIKKDSGFGVAQLILFISIAVLVIFVAWPVLLILFNAFFVDGSFNSHDFYAVLTEPETFQALINSLIIASMTTIGSTIVGTFFAWLVTRTDLPYKNFMKSLFLVPFMLPSFIGTLAWKMLLSPNSGYINKFFIETFGFSGPVFDIYTYHGISAVEVMYLFPFVFIQVCGALERMDPTLKESACISGAGLFTITRKITIPLVMPSIMSGALLIMLYSMAHFGTVAVLGIEQGIYNIPTLIYEKIHQSGAALNLSVPVPYWQPYWLFPQPALSGHSKKFSATAIIRLSAAKTSVLWSSHCVACVIRCCFSAWLTSPSRFCCPRQLSSL